MFLVAGNTLSKVKKLFSYDEEPIWEALPSDPFIVGGLAELPPPGASFSTFFTKKEAEEFLEEHKEEFIETGPVYSAPENESGCTTLALVIKADVIGTLDGILHELAPLKHPRATIKILRAGVGTINENDVALAGTAKHSFVLGFHVQCDKAARDFAEQANVSIELFDIIYKLTEFVEKELKSCARKANIETVLGRAKIIRVFNPVRNLQIIGARVTEGEVKKDTTISMKIIRGEAEVGKGTIEGMQIERVPVKRAEKNDQFGASVNASQTLALGDELVFYTMHEE
jgi:translation initiation factor IF-2